MGVVSPTRMLIFAWFEFDSVIYCMIEINKIRLKCFNFFT